MKLILAAIILGFVALSTATDSTIFPQLGGKANIYNYYGSINIATKQPEMFGTLFKFNAKLTLTRLNNEQVTMQLTEISHHIQHDRVSSWKQIPNWTGSTPEIDTLTKLWIVTIDGSGGITNIQFTTDDQEWSMNMKKSIAAVFTVNLEKVSSVKYSDSFDQVESTIQGPRYVNNDVQVFDDHVKLTKLVNTDSEENKFMTPEYARTYKFHPRDGRLEMSEILSRALVVVHPKGVENEFAYSEEEHSISLMATVNEVVEKGQLANMSEELESLKIKKLDEKCKKFEMTKALDMTGGRMIRNANLLEKIDVMVESVLKYFDKNHITLMKPEMKEVNLINRVLTEMEYADLPTLEILFAKFLAQKDSPKDPIAIRKFYVFMELVPFVGTSSSVILMRNIIRKKKVPTKLITMMLNNFATEVKCPTQQLLEELLDLPTYTADNNGTFQAGVLSLATLTHRVFESEDQKSPLLEKIIAKLENDYKSRRGPKILFVTALGNIGTQRAYQGIMKMYKQETDDVLRAVLLHTAAPVLVKDNSLLRTVVWNVLRDVNTTLELRTIACMIYIQTENPTVSHFLNLYWAMRYEKDEKIYNFMYNSLESLSETGDFLPSKGVGVASIAKLILKMSRKPVIRMELEGWHIVETMDPKNNVGLRVEVMYMSALGNNNFEVTILGKMDGEIVHFATLVGRYVDRELLLRTKRSGRWTNVIFEETWTPTALMNVITQTIGTVSTIDEMGALESILVPISFQKQLSTDLGTPMQIYERFSAMISINATVPVRGGVENQLSAHFKMAATRSLGMKVYNPIADAWQGIHNLDTIHVNLPIAIMVNKTEHGFKIGVNDQIENSQDVGVQSYTETQLFIENVNENIVKMMPVIGTEATTMDYVIPIQRQYVKPETFSVADNLDMGFFIAVQGVGLKVFDCDRDISPTIAAEQFKKYSSNAELISFYFMRWQPYILFAPGIGSCGAGVRYPLSKASNTFEIEHFHSNEGQKAIILSIFEEGTEKVGELKLDYVVNPQLTLRNMSLVGHASGYYDDEKYSANVVMKSVLDTKGYQMKLKVERMPTPDESGSDRTGFELDVEGMRSAEQDQTKHILQRQCAVDLVDGGKLPISKECLVAATSLRKYVLNFKELTADPEKIKKYKKVIEFPLLRNREVDVTKDNAEEVEGVPIMLADYGLDMFLPPVNHFYGLFEGEADVQETYTCVYAPNMFLNFDFMSVDSPVTNEWTALYRHQQNISVWEVSAKRVYGMVARTAIRVSMETDVIECIPNAERVVCEYNGKAMTSEDSYKYLNEYLFTYYITNNPQILFIKTLGPEEWGYFMTIAYDGRSIRIEGSAALLHDDEYRESKVGGKCLEYEKW